MNTSSATVPKRLLLLPCLLAAALSVGGCGNKGDLVLPPPPAEAPAAP